MAQKIKPIYLIIGAVVLFLLFQGNFNFLGAAADVSTATILRTEDSGATSVKAGQSFTLRYTAQGAGSGSWGVCIYDQFSCTAGSTTPTEITTCWTSPEASPSTSRTATITAPGSAGTCNFGNPTGTYDFGGATVKNLNDVAGHTPSITVCVDTDGCPKSAWCSGDWYYQCGNYDGDVCEEASGGQDCAAAGQLCNPSVGCEYDCSNLESNIFTAADAWYITPSDTGLRQAVNNAILLWAQNC